MNIGVLYSMKTLNDRPRGTHISFAEYSFFLSKTVNPNMDEKTSWEYTLFETPKQSALSYPKICPTFFHIIWIMVHDSSKYSYPNHLS